MSFEFDKGCLFFRDTKFKSCANYFIDKKIIPNDYLECQKKRDNGNYHMTVLNPKELRHVIDNNLGKNLMDDRINGIKSLDQKYYILGLGKATNEKCYFLVVNWPTGNTFRNKLGLPNKDFHVTIGFNISDVHNNYDNNYHNSDISKDISTIIEYYDKYFEVDDVKELIKIFGISKKYAKVHEYSQILIRKKEHIYGYHSFIKSALRLGRPNDEIFEEIDIENEVIKNEQNNEYFHKYIVDIVEYLNSCSKRQTQYYFDKYDILIKATKMPFNFSFIIKNKLAGSSLPLTMEQINAFESHGVTDIITLREHSLPNHLFRKDMNRLDGNCSIKIHHFYVDDLGPPTIEQMDSIIDIMERGTSIVHCKAGVGRTAVALICYVMKNGIGSYISDLPQHNSADAIDIVKKLRPWTSLTSSQIAFTQEYSSRLWNISSDSRNITENKIKLPRIIMCVGYPASGKSTFSTFVSKDNENIFRINQDEIRQKGKCEELFGQYAKKNNMTVILDRSNLTKEERGYWFSLVPGHKIWCVYFNTSIEECKFRIVRRQNHPTIPTGTGIKILESLDGKLEEPDVKEGFEKIFYINDENDSNELMLKFGAKELPIVSSDIIKFPRTKHISNVLKSATRDDLIMTETEAKNFIGVDLDITEKVDGCSIGLKISKDYKILVQNRSHYVSSKDGATQFKILDKWVDDHKDALYQILDPPESKILYGELCRCKHSILYTDLPDYFLAFDLLDVVTKKFTAYPKLKQLLEPTNISIVPLISKIKIKNVSELVPLVQTTSRFYDGFVEGIYIKVCNEDEVLHRAKLVRGDFTSGIAFHWSKSVAEFNKIRVNV